MRFNLSQQFEENAVVALWHVCNITPDLIYSLSYHETDAGFRIGGVPSDFHLFWPLKDALCGRHFRSDEDVQEAVYDWLAQQPKD